MSRTPHPRAGAAAGRRAWSGFTLIELLVVMGIVTTLIAILLPTLNKARSQANNLACQANLEQIGQAINIYIGSNRGILPYGFWDGTFNPVTGTDTGFSTAAGGDWTMVLQRTVFLGSPPGLQAKVRNIFFDPEAPPGDTLNSLGLTLVQYACHPRLMPLMGTQDKFAELGKPTGTKCYLRPYVLSHVQHSADIALIFDASLVSPAGGGWSVLSEPVALEVDDGRLNYDTFLTDQYNLATTSGFNSAESIDLTPTTTGGTVNSDSSANPQNIRFRHLGNRSCNVLMADLHVETFTLNSDGTTNLIRSDINVNP